MVKGKPWNLNEEHQLRELAQEGKTVNEISQVLEKSREAIRQKSFNLGIDLKGAKEKQQQRISAKKTCFCSTQLKIPPQLPNVEDTLNILAGALLESAQAGLSKDEITRLQVVANLAKIYKDAFADYIDYRGIEQRLEILEKKYNETDNDTKDNNNT